jgi:iron complex transport system ATP-binding protein
MDIQFLHNLGPGLNISVNRFSVIFRRARDRREGRTMLAAIMATRPSIILADEPGASLDIRHRLDLIARLKELAQDAVVVVVTHDLDLAARFCDRIVLLDEGQVVADGPATAVITLADFELVFAVRFQCERLTYGRDWLIGTN